MEACSSEQSVWAQRKGWENWNWPFRLKRKNKSTKKFLWPLFLSCIEQSAIRCDCWWYSRLIFCLDAQSVLWKSEIQRGTAASHCAPGWCAGTVQGCTDRLCCCSCECKATKEGSWDVRQLPQAQSDLLSSDNVVSPCQDVASSQSKMDWHKVAVLSENCLSFSFRISPNQDSHWWLSLRHLTMTWPWHSHNASSHYAHRSCWCTCARSASWKGCWLSPWHEGPSQGVTVLETWVCGDVSIGQTNRVRAQWLHRMRQWTSLSNLVDICKMSIT